MTETQTLFDFTLPRGYVDADGQLHRYGKMRLATAADERALRKDARVRQNPEYRSVVLLSRVVTGLGGLSEITPKVIEGLYQMDLIYLRDLHDRINRAES